MARMSMKEHLRQQEKSGLTINAYAKRHGIKPNQLYTAKWRQRLKNAPGKNPSGEFLPVEIGDVFQKFRISIELLPNGHLQIPTKEFFAILAHLTAG